MGRKERHKSLWVYHTFNNVTARRGWVGSFARHTGSVRCKLYDKYMDECGKLAVWRE